MGREEKGPRANSRASPIRADGRAASPSSCWSAGRSCRRSCRRSLPLPSTGRCIRSHSPADRQSRRLRGGACRPRSCPARPWRKPCSLSCRTCEGPPSDRRSPPCRGCTCSRRAARGSRQAAGGHDRCRPQPMSWVHQIDLARRLREEALALRGESARARAEAELARTAARKVRRSEIPGNPSELHPPVRTSSPTVAAKSPACPQLRLAD